MAYDLIIHGLTGQGINPNGQAVSWPLIPRIGESIEFSSTGVFKVEDVRYFLGSALNIYSINVYLAGGHGGVQNP